MPKYSAAIVRRYRGLEELTPDDYADFFPKTSKPWTMEDTAYLLEWWGKDDPLSLSYALGRPPWGLQRQITKMRHEGITVDYLREVSDDRKIKVTHTFNTKGA